MPCVSMYYSYQQNPFIKYQLVIFPIITACGDFLMEFPLLRKQNADDDLDISTFGLEDIDYLKILIHRYE